MAKLAGGALGVRRGKVGAEVYSVTGGIQVVKQYQPVVANPNTEGQQIQRLKMMVVGKITKSITPSMLVGLGSRFKARAEFNRTMLRAAQARLSGEQGEWKAVVPAEALVFSRGEMPDAITAEPATISSNGRTVQVNFTQIPGGWEGLRVVAVAGGRLLDISNDFMAKEYVNPDFSSGVVTIVFPSPATEGAHLYVSLCRTVSRAAQNDINGGSISNSDYSIDGGSVPSTAGLEWSHSIWLDYVAPASE